MLGRIHQAVLLLACWFWFAGGEELPAGYRRLSSKPGDNMLACGGFEGESGFDWHGISGQGWTLVPSAGRNGTTGLMKERSAAGEYALAFQEGLALRPGVTYEYGGWIRCDKVTGVGVGIAVEWRRASDGKHLYGAYLPLLSGTADFKLVHGLVTPPVYDFPVVYQMTLYMDRKTLGQAVFDDLFIRPKTGRWHGGMIYPYGETVSDAHPEFVLLSVLEGEFSYDRASEPSLRCQVVIECGGKIVYDRLHEIVDERISVFPDKLSVGGCRVRLRLLDVSNRIMLGDRSFCLRVVEDEHIQRRHVQVDRRGRLWINGRKTMISGIFIHRLDSESVVDRIWSAGFNAVCVYLGHEIRDDMLDYCARKGLWVIPHVGGLLPPGASQLPIHSYAGLTDREKMTDALIGHLKRFPAVLAYYIADEVDAAYAEHLRHLRMRIRALDDSRPTLAVYYQHYLEQAFSQDLMGIDPYPVRTVTSADMALVREQVSAGARTRRLGRGGMGLWAAVQFFNPGTIAADGRDPKVYWSRYRYPTLKELYAMTAWEMLGGVRGFLGFNYDFMHYYRRQIDAKASERFWPLAQRCVAFQRQLSGYLLSGRQPDLVKLSDVVGDVKASVFYDDHGRRALLVAAVGPGKSRAVLTLEPDCAFRIRLGNVKKLDAGRWLFEGQDMDMALGVEE